MKHFLTLAHLTLIFWTVSCSTMKESITLGIASGAATGAAGAQLFSRTDKGEKALTGAAIGAVIGGIASYFIHGSLEERDAETRRKTLFNLENFGVNSPELDYKPAPSSKPSREDDRGWKGDSKPDWSFPSYENRGSRRDR